jgi:hypothetical protein
LLAISVSNADKKGVPMYFKTKNSPVSEPLEPVTAEDDETTRPVSLELIARLATQDPSVQLKVGVLEWKSDPQIGEEEKKPKG